MSTTHDESAAVLATVAAAADAAAPLLPVAEPLVPGNPIVNPTDVPLPGDAKAAVVARLSGEVTGDVVVVLSEAMVAALENSPVGGLDVAASLRPALEAAASTLGAVRAEAERVEDPTSALDGLHDKGVYVVVPLVTANGEHQATFALQVALPTGTAKRGDLTRLRSVPMEVTVEIGRTRMTVQELLSLHPGEIVELDRAAGAPADLLANGTLIARGEVVVGADENFGLRISEIVTDAQTVGR